jgi:asparagine synthase (glutamine-hydrolysing)
MRSAGPGGIFLSGGMDSTALAALAAPMASSHALTGISYVFDELVDCDERQYIDAVVSMYGLPSIQFNADGAWPLRGPQDWAWDPNMPVGNSYRLLMENTYQAAQQAGLRVLLTGHFGDNLYTGEEDWLADLLGEGRLVEAWREAMRHVKTMGLRQSLTSNFSRRVIRRALDRIPGGSRLRRAEHPTTVLTPLAEHCLESLLSSPEPPVRLLHPDQQEALLGAWEAVGFSSEIFYTSRYGLENRYPYRDRRLVEFVLSLPAHQFYNRGQGKYILRCAMQGRLPESVLNRTAPTSFISLYDRGIDRQHAVIRECLENPRALWRRFIQADWLAPDWPALLREDLPGALSLIPWFCISSHIWLQKYKYSLIDKRF